MSSKARTDSATTAGVWRWSLGGSETGLLQDRMGRDEPANFRNGHGWMRRKSRLGYGRFVKQSSNMSSTNCKFFISSGRPFCYISIRSWSTTLGLKALGWSSQTRISYFLQSIWEEKAEWMVRYRFVFSTLGWKFLTFLLSYLQEVGPDLNSLYSLAPGDKALLVITKPMWTWTIVPVYFCFILLLVISRFSWALDDMVRWFTFSLTIALISYISDFLSHHGRCHHSHHGSIQSFSFNQYHFLPIRSLLRSIIIVSGGIKWGLWGKGKGWQTVVIIHSTRTGGNPATII